MYPLYILLLPGCAWLLWKVLTICFHQSPLDKLPGPRPHSRIGGDMKFLFDRHAWDFLDSLQAYGGVSRIRGIFGQRVLHVYDPIALQHVLQKEAYAYDASVFFMEGLRLVFGPGLGATAGNAHRKQRKMLSPWFSTKHMRQLTTVFNQVANKMCDAVCSELRDGPQNLDFFELTGRISLEILGQGALGYSFDPLSRVVHNPFAAAVKELVPTSSKLGAIRFLAPHFKYLGSPAFRRKLVKMSPLPDLRKFADLIDILHDQSKQILEMKKTLLKNGDETLLKRVGEGKDILSVLLKANLNAAGDGLSEDELLAQMSSLVFAGTDTTSSALTQILHLLAEHQEVQKKLRLEIQTVAQDVNVSYDVLNALPLLDAVCRETLRLYPPASFVFREALQEIVMPFSVPVQSAKGESMSQITVPKGTLVVINIRASNTNKNIWGEDALQWRPDRWISPPMTKLADTGLPGVYANMMTFVGGNRSCIGFRFAELELKIVLSRLISGFKISLPEGQEDIYWNMAGVRYPTLGKDTTKASCPLRVESITA